MKYGFICAGGGNWYSKILQLLSPGDRVWVKIPKEGFAGVGVVTGPVQRYNDFMVSAPTGKNPFADLPLTAHYHKQLADDADRCEYFVTVRWLQTVPVSQAVQELGMFGNQNSICKPTAPKWRATVERLKERFPRYTS